MNPPDALPSAPFSEIAEDLFLYASSQARAAEALEWQAAAYPHKVTEAALKAARRSGILAGQVHAFFRRLAPHEEELRDFLAGLLARDGSAAGETNRPTERPSRIIDPRYVAAPSPLGEAA